MIEPVRRPLAVAAAALPPPFFRDEGAGREGEKVPRDGSSALSETQLRARVFSRAFENRARAEREPAMTPARCPSFPSGTDRADRAL